MKTNALKAKAKEMIDGLPEKRVRALLDLMEYLEEREAWEATFELERNKRLLADYVKTRRALKEGRTTA